MAHHGAYYLLAIFRNRTRQRTLTIGGSITVRLTSCLFCLDSAALLVLNQHYIYMQTSQTVGQSFSNTSSNGECSLDSGLGIQQASPVDAVGNLNIFYIQAVGGVPPTGLLDRVDQRCRGRRPHQRQRRQSHLPGLRLYADQRVPIL